MEEEILKWYQQMGIDEIIVDQPGQLTKKIPKKVIYDDSNLVSKARMIADK